MDDLLMAIKAAGASACSGNFGLSTVRMQTAFSAAFFQAWS
jgi:hypothetical protein